MKLQLAPKLALPLDAVTQTFCIFGKRGSGKTNGATVLVEELLKAHLPVVVLDPVDAWWGLKASFDGKKPGLPVYVFGGAHQDLPLESTAGALLADVVAKERLPIVLSMKEWGVAERARFVTDFAKRLLQVNTQPVMMVLEEADAFIPQRPAKGEEAMLGAMDRLVRWGRQSGVGCTIVTQRSAKVNKDVTTQAETLIAFRTTGPQDRDAIDGWIKYHAGEALRDELMATLPTLPNGTGWVWSPEWLDVFGQYAFRRRATYDSAATPKVGEKRPKPKHLAAVDLNRLRAQMAETVERAKAEDPRELRQQIAELKQQLAKKPPAPAKAPPQKVVEKFVLKDGQLKRLQKDLDRFGKAVDRLIESRTVIAELTDRLMFNAKDITAAIRQTQQRDHGTDHVPGTSSLAGRRDEPTSRAAPAPVRVDPLGVRGRQPNASERAAMRARSPSPDGALSKMHRAILTALAQHPRGLTKRQILVHTGYRESGSTSAVFTDLSRAHYVQGDRSQLAITEAGLQALGPFDPLPLGDELRAWLLTGDKLTTMEKALLTAICGAYPEPIRKGEVLEQAGYADSGSTSAAFTKLVTYNYAVPQGPSMLKAADELFS
jgi:hypothetical protein